MLIRALRKRRPLRVQCFWCDMQIVILAGILVSALALEVSSRTAPLWAVIIAVGAYLAVTAALSRLSASLGLKAMRDRRSPLSDALRWHNTAALMIQIWLVAGSAALVALGYGQWIMADLGLRYIPLLGKLVVVTPFVVALILDWTLAYPLHRAMRLSLAQSAVLEGRPPTVTWTRREYLANNIRHHLLFIAVLVGLMLLVQDILVLYVAQLLPESLANYIISAAAVLTAIVIFLIAPFLIVRIWRTQRLPDGPLRSELEVLCRRLKLQFREMLSWRSGGVIANAGVVGLLPQTRYILLSDALLDNLPTPYIRAIFAHEAGHIIHRHLLYAAMFALATAVLCNWAGMSIAGIFGWGGWQEEMLVMALLITVWSAAFGWLSRHLERQSDVTAAWLSGTDTSGGENDGDRITAEGSAIFAQALEQVAKLNGTSPRQRNWRHGSIASRVGYILWLGSRGGSKNEIDRLVKRIKLTLWAAVVAAATLGIWQLIVHIKG